MLEHYRIKLKITSEKTDQRFTLKHLSITRLSPIKEELDGYDAQTRPVLDKRRYPTAAFTNTVH
jgi:hypothetical protein